MDPHDSPLRSLIVIAVPMTHSPIPYKEPASRDSDRFRLFVLNLPVAQKPAFGRKAIQKQTLLRSLKQAGFWGSGL